MEQPLWSDSRGRYAGKGIDLSTHHLRIGRHNACCDDACGEREAERGFDKENYCHYDYAPTERTERTERTRRYRAMSGEVPRGGWALLSAPGCLMPACLPAARYRRCSLALRRLGVIRRGVCATGFGEGGLPACAAAAAAQRCALVVVVGEAKAAE